jgi:hypothetical protein
MLALRRVTTTMYTETNMKALTKTGIAAVALLGTFGVVGCKAEQPKPQCKVQPAEYAAAYNEPEMTGDCTDKVIPGEALNLQYYPPDPNTNKKIKIAILSSSAAGAIEAAEHAEVDVTADPAFDTSEGVSTAAIGEYATIKPNDKDMCVASELEPTSLTIPEIMADPTKEIEHHDAVDLTYTWSNFRMLVKATSNGIYFGADLERKDGACTVNYKVTGIFPALSCEGTKEVEVIDPVTMKPMVDDEGNVVHEEVGTGEPDEDKCLPVTGEGADIEYNGLSQDLEYECEHTTLLCMPVQQFPALKK